MQVSVVGLGKLGAVLAAVLAESGEEVIGVDVNPAAISAINEHRAPVNETGLDDLIRKNAARLTATPDLETAIEKSSVTFVVLPTPSKPDGSFSLDYIKVAAKGIAQALRKKQAYHLVVISSTVMPGSMDEVVLPLVEQISGKTCGVDFGLCYNPEFIALGSVIRDMSSPDMILIGESDERAGAMLEELYKRVCKNRPPVARMNFVNAELTKISVNTYVTMKISYANTLAEICGQVPGADAAVVAKAVGLDSRISGKYLQGALGYGGPCFPRDNAAFSYFARECGVDADLADATDEVNRRQVRLLGDRVLELVPEGETVGVMGLSYKPGTEVIEESQGIQLAQYLTEAGREVIVYDPQAMASARKVLSPQTRFAKSMKECAAEASVLVIATAWKEFRSLTADQLKPGATVIDCWRILDRAAFDAYETCGLGPASELAVEAENA